MGQGRSSRLIMDRSNLTPQLNLSVLQRPMRHEILLWLLGLYTTTALIVRAGIWDGRTWQTIFATAAYAAVCYCRNSESDRWQKLRLLAGYFFVLWYFLAVASFVSALQLPAQDEVLTLVDEKIFGVTPAVPMQRMVSKLMTETMSGFYLSYLVYLHVAIVHAGFMQVQDARRFAGWILSIYAISMPIYLLVPATGPGMALPDSFGVPLEGWLLTDINRAIVEPDGAIYDVFPSLHVLITCALLTYDFQHHRRRFWIMLVPSAGMFVSTLYLRYHYAIDLIAGFWLFLVAYLLFAERRPVDVAADH